MRHFGTKLCHTSTAKSMAASLPAAFLCPLLLALLSSSIGRAKPAGCFIKAIYNFGDSIADTGNLLRMGPSGFFNPIGHFPYGITMNKSTGRCSDGLLVIDYLAMALNLSIINPYLDKKADFTHGVNFAVAGATALDESFFIASDVIMPYAASSLGVQLGWFDTHLSSICSSRQVCAKKLERTLFIVGEIGGNDYNFAFYQGRSIQDVASFVPEVIQRIKDSIKQKVIDAGAVHVIVPGNFPIGCMPSYMAILEDKPKVYDSKNCLKDLNTFSAFHNKKLQETLESLRQEYPHVSITYADYYEAFMELLDKASDFGFDKSNLLKSCCGGGGKYNFDINTICGTPGTWACSDPARHISWDGIHLTQEAYKLIARSLVHKFINPSSKSHEIWKC